MLRLFDVRKAESDTVIVIRDHYNNRTTCCTANHQPLPRYTYIYADQQCIEICVTVGWGRTACIILEDKSDWKLTISGQVRKDRTTPVTIPVSGSRDFDMEMLANGTLRFQCRDGYTWSNGGPATVDVEIPMFVD